MLQRSGIPGERDHRRAFAHNEFAEIDAGAGPVPEEKGIRSYGKQGASHSVTGAGEAPIRKAGLPRLIFLAASALLLFLLSQCQHARIRFDGCSDCKGAENSAGQTFQTKVVEQDEVFWFWGLSPDKIEYQAQDLCPEKGVLEVYNYSSLMDGILENVTLGIFAPRTMRITCNKGEPES
ncbi:MAG TPA: hypothetical protein DEA96_17925 [Leptospiraceae bacterium]|nr:hypothetical protein [Spirochaetaceae bacterium]HBS06854.1 hypothetical protein [Leptospiraceae bacterium]|tara:strand:+ start:528 stop:1064 length:537 start_codon:yes stop_codon:yes gene_type:complete